YLALTAHAADAPAPTPRDIKVALVAQPPFVMDNKGVMTGFSVDLWKEIANLNKWTSTYSTFPNMQAGLDAVTSGKCDVLVSDTSITSDRLKIADFSQPFFRGGLQVMITDARPHTWLWAVKNLWELMKMPVLQIGFVVVVALTLIVMWFESKHNPTFPK